MTSDVYAVVLAAGGSSRLGSPKHLLEFQGKTLIHRCLDSITALLGSRVILVLKSVEDVPLYKLTDRNVAFVFNSQWEEGIASSIRAGIAEVPWDAGAALIHAIDQPLITSENLSSLITLWRSHGESIVACEYENTVGIPAIFPRRFFAELSRLVGDRGAKHLLFEQDTLIRKAVPEAGIDVDTMDDWRRLNDHWSG